MKCQIKHELTLTCSVVQVANQKYKFYLPTLSQHSKLQGDVCIATNSIVCVDCRLVVLCNVRAMMGVSKLNSCSNLVVVKF